MMLCSMKSSYVIINCSKYLITFNQIFLLGKSVELWTMIHYWTLFGENPHDSNKGILFWEVWLQIVDFPCRQMHGKKKKKKRTIFSSVLYVKEKVQSSEYDVRNLGSNIMLPLISWIGLILKGTWST